MASKAQDHDPGWQPQPPLTDLPVGDTDMRGDVLCMV